MLLGIGIVELLLKKVSCYGLKKENNSKINLTCRSKLVSYYPPKGFLMIDHDSQALKNTPLRVKKYIHDIDMFDSDYVMTCNAAITSVRNTLNNIYLSTTILN